jgi:integrase
VKTTAVEDWLESYPHSRQIKSHVRNLMHTLFQAAIRWEMIERNPIDLVRQSGKRLKKPRVLTPAEFKSVLEMLSEPYKMMVIAVACLGLRVSELVALQWGRS